LTRYYAHTHPSQPNYLAALAGDYFGNNHDDWVRLPENVATVVDLLEDKKVTWAGYFEDMPGPGYMGNASDGSTGTDGWDYVRKHKWVYSPFSSSIPTKQDIHSKSTWLTLTQPVRDL
jgi:hypothetical protein